MNPEVSNQYERNTLKSFDHIHRICRELMKIKSQNNYIKNKRVERRDKSEKSWLDGADNIFKKMEINLNNKCNV